MPENPLWLELREQIRTDGPLPFDQWMRQALYHPQLGYYRRAPLVQIGRRGDFFTNVSVGPLYGRLLARAWGSTWEELGRPEPFWILEQGAHDGRLAADILTALRLDHSECFEATRYGLVEPADAVAARQAQAATLEAAGFFAKAAWIDDEAQEPSAAQQARTPPSPASRQAPLAKKIGRWLGVVEPAQLEAARQAALAPPTGAQEAGRAGVFFCHELLDSFPVHRVRYLGGKWIELYVHWQENRFRWLEGPPSTVDLAQTLEVLAPQLPGVEGYTTEICTQLAPWFLASARRLVRGRWVIIDYGMARARYYSPERTDGTLQCYWRHQRYPDPLALAPDAVGEFDLTAHVDWTAVDEAAAAAGIARAEFSDQHRYLTRVAAPLLAANDAHLDAAAFKTLVHPEVMGSRFGYWVGRRSA